MRQMFSALKQAVRKSILVLGLISLLTFPGLLITQPSLAAPISPQGQKLMPQQKMDDDSQAAQREEAYEEQVEAEKDPDKVFRKNLREEHADEGVVQKAVEGTKELVERVTGTE